MVSRKLNKEGSANMLLGFLWGVLLVLQLYSMFAFIGDAYRVFLIIFYIIALVLTLFSKYKKVYAWFAGISGIFVIFWIYVLLV